jgi:hypothetical protein
VPSMVASPLPSVVRRSASVSHPDQTDCVECQNPLGARAAIRPISDTAGGPLMAASSAVRRRRQGPCVDGSGLAGAFSRVQQWSEQPCVRPVSAVHVTAGHNALRGSGPGQKHAFDNAVARVGCPDRRIDRLCITCCSLLPTVHITPDARRDLFHVASATGSL